MMYKWIIAAALFAAALGGCSSKNETAPSASETPVGETSSQVTSDAANVQLTIDSTPQAVCEFFIQRLRAGQLEQAEKCLTQPALAQIREKELELSAPGGATATYRYRDAEFASAKQEIAFVPCVVVEQGETDEFRMMLRRGDRGWKIAGMLLQSDGVSTDLVSFENPNDVLRIKSMLGADADLVREAELPSTLR